VAPLVHTTPPKEDKVDTSSVEVPTVQALAVRLGSKAPNDNLVDENFDLLNLDVVESETVYRMSSRL
jgi:hypothetical protein